MEEMKEIVVLEYIDLSKKERSSYARHIAKINRRVKRYGWKKYVTNFFRRKKIGQRAI